MIFETNKIEVSTDQVKKNIIFVIPFSKLN